jgi:hypothetical protein
MSTLDNQVVGLSIAAVLNNALDLQSASSALTYAKSLGLSSGVGAGQADKIFTDTRTIAASGTDDLDLAGVLLDPLGAVVSMARVKGLIVVAAAANTNNVVIGAAAATQWQGPFGAVTHTIHVRPGGIFMDFATDATAWPVVGGASDLLRITNGGAGTGVTYDIIIIGASA